jgi:hypothetical protein
MCGVRYILQTVRYTLDRAWKCSEKQRRHVNSKFQKLPFFCMALSIEGDSGIKVPVICDVHKLKTEPAIVMKTCIVIRYHSSTFATE